MRRDLAVPTISDERFYIPCYPTFGSFQQDFSLCKLPSRNVPASTVIGGLECLQVLPRDSPPLRQVTLSLPFQLSIYGAAVDFQITLLILKSTPSRCRELLVYVRGIREVLETVRLHTSSAFGPG
jgi:hypothetical protein